MPETTPMRCLTGLWSAVLQAGLDDALQPFPERQPDETEFHYKSRSRQWKEDQAWPGSRDFCIVCEFAGLDPDVVLEYYRTVA